jgi:hypothetical protein
MLNFQKNQKNKEDNNNNVCAKKPVDLRQKLLQKEFESLKQIPNGCHLQFDNPDVLHQFKLRINPDNDSIWKAGNFEFLITVSEGLILN